MDKSGTSVNDASFYCGPFLILVHKITNDEPDTNLQEKEDDRDWGELGLASPLPVNKSNNTASDPHLYANHCA